MGTNYYWNNKCPTCGHSEEIHIGKSSCGWVFSLNVHPDKDINSLPDWESRFLIPTSTITDEYGDVISVQEMMETITERSHPNPPPEEWLSREKAIMGPNNLTRHPIGEFCIGYGDGTWDLMVGEFS
jgi:hypothetical protein